MVSLAAGVAGATLQLRDGAGAPCSDALDGTTTARKRDTDSRCRGRA